MCFMFVLYFINQAIIWYSDNMEFILMEEIDTSVLFKQRAKRVKIVAYMKFW